MLRHKTSFLPGSLAFILAAERSFVNLIATFVKVNVYSVRLLILHSRIKFRITEVNFCDLISIILQATQREARRPEMEE